MYVLAGVLSGRLDESYAIQKSKIYISGDFLEIRYL